MTNVDLYVLCISYCSVMLSRHHSYETADTQSHPYNIPECRVLPFEHVNMMDGDRIGRMMDDVYYIIPSKYTRTDDDGRTRHTKDTTGTHTHFPRRQIRLPVQYAHNGD
jgi:hypothetical protein